MLLGLMVDPFSDINQLRLIQHGQDVTTVLIVVDAMCNMLWLSETKTNVQQNVNYN